MSFKRNVHVFLLAIIGFAFCNLAHGFVDDNSPCDVAAWQRLSAKYMLTWGSRDTLLRRHSAPVGSATNHITLHAWRGERVGTEAVLYTRVKVDEPVKVRVLCDGRTQQGEDAAIVGNQVTGVAGFLRYVWTDDFRGCGDHPTDWPGWGVPDCIDLPSAELATEVMECRPIWLALEVGRQVKAGNHQVKLQLVGCKTNKVLGTLKATVEVDTRTLPEPFDYKFHLDFWQQPYSVSRYYNVKPWSEEHKELLRPYLKRLARAGQKVVSAILFYEPWGRQSNDKFEPMVQTIRKTDGSFTYDYSVFDAWVNLMDECGINQQIDCYSMVPWDMSFRFFDEFTGQYQTLQTKTSTHEYKLLWTSFLQNFAKHLREKGWFDKTCIAMDERGMQDMLNAYKVAQEAVPGIRMTLAGNLHEELLPILHDYCLPIGAPFTAEQVAARRARGQYSTLYTCCTEDHPNILSNSVPQESAFIPLYCSLAGQDGYLHWAWLNWTDDPLHDTRFKYFSPGDTYILYPDNRSSVRWERFVEGVLQCEKTATLSAEKRKSLAEKFMKTDVSSAQAVKEAVDEVEDFLNSKKKVVTRL